MVTKDSVQALAREAFAKSGYWGLIAMATRTGKSKIGVDEAAAAVEANPNELVVLAVPTTKLRDKNWEDEFRKWGHMSIYENNLHRTCYASITNIRDKDIGLLILDEGHWLTALSAGVFKANRVKRCLVLTATPPNPNGNDLDSFKIELFARLKLKTIFRYNLTQAVADGIAAPYTIKVVECRLDNTTKYIKGGTQKKPFMQTERQRYDYLTKIINNLRRAQKYDVAQFKVLERMQLIKKLKSKTEIARRIIAKHVKPEDRYLVFCGSKEQCDSLGGKATYHSSTKSEAFDAFLAEELNHLYCVDAINEGITIPEINGSVIVQGNSNVRVLAQRLGRNVGIRDDHEAVIWVLVTMDSVDEEWWKKAIEDPGIDKSRIEYYHYKNVI